MKMVEENDLPEYIKCSDELCELLSNYEFGVGLNCLIKAIAMAVTIHPIESQKNLTKEICNMLIDYVTYFNKSEK